MVMESFQGLMRPQSRQAKKGGSSQAQASTPQPVETLDDFIGWFGFVKPEGVGDVRAMSVDERQALARELGWGALRRGRVDAIRASAPDSWFGVIFNGVALELPRFSLLTMSHCINASADGRLELSIERAHWERMNKELSDGSTFLDIGASTGAMSVPYAMQKGRKIRAFAFEPSRRAKKWLDATLTHNKIAGVTTFPYALSDRSGQSDFLEMAEDPTGRTPFLPETSRLAHPKEAVSKANAEIYKVETRTLDEIAPELDLGRDSKLVCKIDVEAFEHQVLKGGQKTIKEHRPFLSIDLQFHPGTDVLTDKACMEILRPLGYEFEHLGHVMIAVPK